MDWQKVGSLLAIIGGFLTLISIFFPMASVRWELDGSDVDIYYWIWGILYAEGREEWIVKVKFAPEFYGFVLGIAIGLSASLTIIKSYWVRKGKGGGATIFILAILTILALIAWIFAVELKYAGSMFIFGKKMSLNFWDFFDFSYGVYMLFVGANLSIIGALIKMKS